MKLRSINNNESHNRQKLAVLKEKLERIETQRNELFKDFEKVTIAAREKGERVDTDEPLEELQEKIAKMKAQLKHGLPVNLDPQSIRELIATKKEELDANQGTFENLKISILMVNILRLIQSILFIYVHFIFSCENL